MGEEGETIKFCSWNDTTVFWNMDDYPIPVGVDDLNSIRINIQEALQQFGFHGDRDVNVHCKLLECDLEEKLRDAGIFYFVSCTLTYMRLAAVDRVTTMDMTTLLVDDALTAQAMNFAVIAKPKGELARVLNCLKARGHTILLIDPPECSFTVESLLRYAHLVVGASDVKEEDPTDVEEDSSKIIDFLEPIRPVQKDMTAVFWDAQDCPFPLGSTPDDIYHSIASALVERGFTDNITIWAYLGDAGASLRDDLLGDKTWASTIYFLPGGDKDSRRIRMANDILFFRKSGFPESLILVSDQFKADLYYLEQLYLSRVEITFIYPTQDINQPESPEWPRLLIDEGHYHFPSGSSEICYEPCPAGRLKKKQPRRFQL